MHRWPWCITCGETAVRYSIQVVMQKLPALRLPAHAQNDRVTRTVLSRMVLVQSLVGTAPRS